MLAVDVDLHRVTAWSDVHGTRLVHGSPGELLVLPDLDAEVLIEIASPMLYRDAHHKKTLAWMIWNASAVTTITRLLENHAHRVSVSPSSKWTLGYSLEARMLLAEQTFGPLEKMTKAKAHDVNECRAMIAMHRKRPDRWVSLEEYLLNL